MPDATDFGRQWAGMVASVVPASPASLILNAALAVDPSEPPSRLERLAHASEEGGAEKWGLSVDGADERAASTAERHAGLPVYERLGFELHLYEQRLE